ncbi:unnamed protein product [Ilex paraguariensis]|uniref:PGG domain-containing protein n=1 Tax=Ilex paraguariensis TaxID=185542 RepID=A0ABC8QQX1_9AQUA
MLARTIRHILCDVGALEGRFLSNYREKPPPSHRRKRRYKIVSLEVHNVLIMVFVMTATLTFTASWDPKIVYQPQNPVENHWHLVLGGSNQFRASFYYMMFNIAGFIASMGAILVLIWPLPFRAVLTFVLVTTIAIYGVLVDKTMPRFNIMLGSSHIFKHHLCVDRQDP